MTVLFLMFLYGFLLIGDMTSIDRCYVCVFLSENVEGNNLGARAVILVCLHET